MERVGEDLVVAERVLVEPQLGRQVFERFVTLSARVDSTRNYEQSKRGRRISPRYSFGPYPFQAVVVRRVRSTRNRHRVRHESISALNSGGKSDPTLTIHETAWEFEAPAARRAPRAANVPAPPMIFCSAAWPLRCSISSVANLVNLLHSPYRRQGSQG